MFGFTSISFGQNKVVVVPLGDSERGSDLTDVDLVPLRVWRGLVDDDGTKFGTGRFTSSRISTGRYDVILDLDIPGLDSSGLGIPGFGAPVVSLRFASPGDTINITAQTRAIGRSGQVEVLSFEVRTYDSAAAPADRAFSFHYMLDEPEEVPETKAVNSFHPAVQCTNVDGIETCSIGK